MAVLADVLIEDARWSDSGLEASAEGAARATMARLNIAEAEISLLACSDARIADLNADFRGKPQPTNVLSWPSEERGAEADGAMPNLQIGPDVEIGDIALAYETCHREAAEAGRAPADHITHLIVHGVLHLMGFDHERDADAALMEGIEVDILAGLGIADPYRVE